MTAAIIVQPEAEADLAEALAWYEARREGLGGEFVEAVSQAFSRIADQPRRYAVVHRDVRRVLLRRFPYVVLYIVRDERVFVLGVLHQRRNPRVLQSRARAFKED